MSSDINLLGSYLKSRRAKIDPQSLGYTSARRRTPGLRREEVAQRAHVSATWYTWLEQGRGGCPSASVLERLARALDLDAAEREHLFMLAQQRPPKVRHTVDAAITPQLQGVLDSLELSPAFVKTASWDVVGCNKAACVILTDYPSLPPAQRNVMRVLFSSSYDRRRLDDWNVQARFLVAAFRSEVTRAGLLERCATLVEELRATCPEFDRLWQEQDVQHFGQGLKRLHHHVAGTLSLEYSAFQVDGRPDLTMVVYTPASARDREQIRHAIDQSLGR